MCVIPAFSRISSTKEIAREAGRATLPYIIARKFAKRTAHPGASGEGSKDGVHIVPELPALVYFKGSRTLCWADNSDLQRLSPFGGNETMCTVDSSNNPALGVAEIGLLKVLRIFVID